MEITIKVTGVDRLADAILALARAIQGGNMPAQGQQQTQQQTQQTIQAQTQQAQPPVQMQQPAPPIQPQLQVQDFVATSQQQIPQQAYPAQQPPQQMSQQVPVQTIPTTAVTQGFSMDQLAIAATSLVDAGKQAVLMGILQQFGVQYLTQVSTENYSALAARLREAGAKI